MNLAHCFAQLRQNSKSRIYAEQVRKQCYQCGKNLKVNHPFHVTRNTILKNNVYVHSG